MCASESCDYSEVRYLDCPNCGKSSSTEFWLIIDGKASPDLVVLVAENQLHVATCLHCGATVRLDLPLLLFHSESVPHLIYSPADGASEIRQARHLRELLTVLSQQLGASWQDAWVAAGVTTMGRPDLVLFLEDALARGEEADNAYMGRLEQVQELLMTYLRDPDSLDDHLMRHPELLDEEVEQIFDELIDDADSMGDLRATMVEKLAELRAALQVRRDSHSFYYPGTKQPDQTTKGAADARSALATPYAAEVNDEALFDALSEYTSVDNWADCQRVVERKPILLTDQADAYLTSLIAFIRSEGAEDAAERHEWLQNILRRCRQVGISRAFAEMSVVGSDAVSIAGGYVQQRDEAWERYERTGDQTELDRAVEVEEQILSMPEFSGLSEEIQLMTWSGAANSLIERYEITGSGRDLDQALCYAHQAASRITSNSRIRASVLKSLGNCLRLRYARDGEHEDLEEAIQKYQEAIQLMASESGTDLQSMAGLYSDLGLGLNARYEATGKPADLDESIDALERACADAPSDAIKHNNLAQGLMGRYLLSGSRVDVDGAIDASRRAVELVPRASPTYPLYLNNLGNGLRFRFELVALREDLDEAISVLITALQHIARDPPHLPALLSNLGTCLRLRHSLTGSLEDLEQARQFHQQAVAKTPLASSALPSRLNSLAASLSMLAELTGQHEYLAQAIEYSRQAIQHAPPDSPYSSIWLMNLATNLSQLWHKTGRMSILDEAIKVAHEAQAKASPDSTYHLGSLSTLGSLLLDRYWHTHDSEDLDHALQACRQAVDEAKTEGSSTPVYLHNLARALRFKYECTGEAIWLTEARKTYESACRRGLETNPNATITSARSWGDWALELAAWKEAAKAYDFGLMAIDRVLSAQLLRTGKEDWLRAARDISTNAAYALARTGQLQESVRVLEAGRARLLGEALEQSRSDLDRLASLGHAKLLARYRRVADRVELLRIKMSDPDSLGIDSLSQSLRELDIQQELTIANQDLQSILTEIRLIPGYEDFFLQPTFERVSRAATAEKPLVYVLTTPMGSLALCVHRKDGAVCVARTRLDGLTATNLIDILKGKGDNVADSYLAGAALARTEVLHRALDEIWPSMQTRLMEPLTAALTKLGYDQGVLIPSGLLGLLPLHAVVLDKITLTFAPSARSIEKAPVDWNAAPPSFLGIGNPTRHELDSLMFARHEIEGIGMLFSRQDHKQTILCEDAATLASVMGNLPDVSHLHFACHGRFDVDTPLASALYLAGDDTLTLRDVLDGDVAESGIRLVVLSACQTGITDFIKIPDEVVGFPAGFIQAGVPGVVSTLWPVNDLSTSLLMARFYHHLLVDDREPGVALHQAQVWLRDATASKMNLAHRFERRWQESGKRDKYAFWAMRHYQLNPDSKPFAHPYYWAAFAFSGV